MYIMDWRRTHNIQQKPFVLCRVCVCVYLHACWMINPFTFSTDIECWSDGIWDACAWMDYTKCSTHNHTLEMCFLVSHHSCLSSDTILRLPSFCRIADEQQWDQPNSHCDRHHTSIWSLDQTTTEYIFQCWWTYACSIATHTHRDYIFGYEVWISNHTKHGLTCNTWMFIEAHSLNTNAFIIRIPV